MSYTHTPLTNELASYVRAASLREPDILRRLRDETAPLADARMQITPEQGQFMSLLLRLLGARRVLELGVFTGYSTLCMALALPAGGKVIACDVSEEWTVIARRYWREAGVGSKIDLRLAPAADTMAGLLADGQAGSFDFVFIDADKLNYEMYYEQALLLVREGGIIGIDNVLWHGAVADPLILDDETEAIRRLNRLIHQDERVALSLVPIGDGLTLAAKNRSGNS